ncbi:hypothetical protein MBLNU13_g05120t1 [Cladosporium sp. NU13]
MEPQYLDDLAALNKDGNDYIRLLRVHTPSSRPKEATLCELRVFSLRHAPRYLALSYCQQPESGIVNIDVRGSVNGLFPVSRDLSAATRAATFHHHRRSGWLWIDALCIDQSSNDEKNDQVPRMGDIYKMAYAAFIWLGNTVARRTASVFVPRDEDLYPGSFINRRYYSTKENNDMLDDVLRNIESSNDELDRERLRSRHVSFQRFKFDVDRSANGALFATECGFVGGARPRVRQRPGISGPLPDASVRTDDIIDCSMDGIVYGELMALAESE